MNDIVTNLPGYLTIIAVLILAGACSSKISSRLNVPVLLVFLGVGMLAGTDFLGIVAFDNAVAANVIGSIAMAFILFSGGYDTSWKSVKSVIGYGSVLSSLGVLLTALFVGLFTFALFAVGFRYFPQHLGFTEKPRFEWYLLLGAIVSSTDAAAVFSILRSRSVSLRGKLRPLLEYESGSNDPMAAFLTIFMVGMILTPGESYWMILPAFLVKMTLGIFYGFLIAKLTVWIFNMIDFEYDGLYYVLGIGAVLLTFGASEFSHGNGFMSVYVCGMVMGNSKFIYQHGVGRFHDGVGWLMQVMLFGMLGLLCYPKQLPNVLIPGLAIALFLMLAARPLAVFLCMIGSKFTMKERLFVSWVGLRGGAPIMLATFALMANLPDAWKMFNIVFFIVLASVLLQGKTLMPLARLLKLDKPLKASPRVPLEFENTGTLNGDMREFEVQPCAPYIGKKLAELGLPKGALVLLIRRGREFVVPHGSTVIEAHDGLMILADPKTLEAAEPVLNCEQAEETATA
jgi:NhaP-type Na+/H+ and K+/H+ antiporters with a unique C-terminal domain